MEVDQDLEAPGAEEESEQTYVPNLRPQHTGLVCFLNMQRPCGSDCMAYTTHPRHSSISELNDQSVHCSIIAGVERTGRNITILTELMSRAEKKKLTAEADKKRESQFESGDPLRSPFGGRKKE